MLLCATISSDEISRQCGCIYAVLVVEESQVYIGQTRASLGALGRLSQHLAFNSPSTLRKRVNEILGAELSNLGPVEFAAVRLANQNIFHNEARDYREAVEALCQYNMIAKIQRADFNLGFISRVNKNGYTKDSDVLSEAERVSSKLFSWLEEICTH